MGASRASSQASGAREPGPFHVCTASSKLRAGDAAPVAAGSHVTSRCPAPSSEAAGAEGAAVVLLIGTNNLGNGHLPAESAEGARPAAAPERLPPTRSRRRTPAASAARRRSRPRRSPASSRQSRAPARALPRLVPDLASLWALAMATCCRRAAASASRLVANGLQVQAHVARKLVAYGAWPSSSFSLLSLDAVGGELSETSFWLTFAAPSGAAITSGERSGTT